MIRDQTRPNIEANQAAVAILFRRAVKAKSEQWHADRGIEKLLGVELELADTLDHFAAGIDNARDALSIDADAASTRSSRTSSTKSKAIEAMAETSGVIVPNWRDGQGVGRQATG